MTAEPVQWVLDELGAVVEDQPSDHPLKRVDRDTARVYDGGGTFDMSAAMKKKSDDFRRGNYVGVSYADRSPGYIGTGPDLDVEEVVGIRIEGASMGYAHIDPTGQDGAMFYGEGSLVDQIRSTLYDNLQFPDAGRTPVAFTHLTITNESPVMSRWQEYFRYDFDVVFDGFEEL